MLVVSVEFLFGTFRGDPDGTSNTGRLTRGEWPPAPSRLFAALVAADGTGQRCRVTDGSELLWFEQLPAPLIHADRADLPSAPPSPLCGQACGWRQPRGRTKSTSPALGPSSAPERAWPCVIRVSSIVGMSMSPIPCSSHCSTEPHALDTSVRPTRPRAYGSRRECPNPSRSTPSSPMTAGTWCWAYREPGDVRILDRMYEQWRERGASVTRLQFPALRHEAHYRSTPIYRHARLRRGRGLAPPRDRGVRTARQRA